MAFTPQQARFGFYDDDNSATSSTASAAQDTNITADTSADIAYQLRIGVQETGGTGSGASPGSGNWQLQYSKNGGAWTDVTAASSDVRAFASDFVSHGDSVATSRLTGGAGSYDAGEISETGEVSNSSLDASAHTELLYTIELVAADLSDGDTLDFRVLYGGAVLTGGYSVTPRATADSGINLLPALFTNTQTFFAPTIAGGTLVASLLVNAQTFYAPSLSMQAGLTLTAPLLTNAGIFYSATIDPSFFTKDPKPPAVVVEADAMRRGIFDPAIFDPAIFDTESAGTFPTLDTDAKPTAVTLE